jgi:2-polyprenyl-6-methoxyphenol hydroxylase-like FAD-dependent oxidoreductase
MAKILVVGGSLGGLFVGNLLHCAGHEVHILEKVLGSLDGRGAGIVTHPSLMQALSLVGITLDDNIGVPVQGRVTLDAKGDTIAQMHLPQVLTSWSRLYHLLKEKFPASRYHGGKALHRLEQDTAHVTAYCEDGTQFTGDLLIASDGLRSAVRAILCPKAMPEYAGYVAWRGVCDEHLLSQHTLNTLFEYFSFGLPEGEQILGYPVAGLNNNITPGNRRYNFVWYHQAPANNALRDLLTDADGNYFPQGIAPVKVSYKHIAHIRERARKTLAPQWAEVLEKTGMVFFQPIYDVYSEKIAFEKIALMGDASFVARPHVGMGVSKAAEDAMSLCNHIEQLGASPEAILAYQNDRLRIGQRVIARAQYLGQYMSAQGQEELKKDLQGIAKRVMAETAVDITTLLQSQNPI